MTSFNYDPKEARDTAFLVDIIKLITMSSRIDVFCVKIARENSLLVIVFKFVYSVLLLWLLLLCFSVFLFVCLFVSVCCCYCFLEYFTEYLVNWSSKVYRFICDTSELMKNLNYKTLNNLDGSHLKRHFSVRESWYFRLSLWLSGVHLT